VLINLVKNALKFTKQGIIEIESTYDQLERCIRVNIRDTGIGIPKEEIKNLFRTYGKLHDN